MINLKNNIKCTFFSLLCILIFLSGCSTLRNTNEGILNGMIYDADNQPVSNATLTLNGEQSVKSDIHGHFSFINVQEETDCTVNVTKDTFEPLSADFNYNAPTQILYLRIFSADQLLERAEMSLKKQNWQKSEQYLRRAQKSGGDNICISYLYAVLAVKKKQYETAVAILEKELAEGADQPYIHLFLADLYQYRTGDQKKALAQLQMFLQERSDPAVEVRLTALQNKTQEN